MPSLLLIFIRVLLFGATIPYWLWLAREPLNPVATFACIILAVAASYPTVWIGRRLLDAKPSKEQMQWVTTGVHFLLLLCLGTAIIAAIITANDWRGWAIPLDKSISYWLMVVTSLIAFATVVNLALRGWGAPFAITLTRRLATDWMYAWTRNPMVLSTLAFFVALGLWLQSTLFVLWVLLWLTPAFVFFLKVYEERELEIRLGKSYLDYRAKTSFMWPRRPRVNR
ncbi:MAG TPA: methyltransferase [Anaerolineales bacterium]|jgi:protein-S-isoprenylcysteine O-methyltransferase Ste14|nr:methyltransferase [Anaerolineales bacterium]